MKPLDHLIRPGLNVTGRGKLTILIYHRVLPIIDALFPSTVDAQRFDEQMSWVAAALNIVPLHEGIEMVQKGRLPSRAASITFDDGYADNIDVGLPILLRHGLCATFFVASGFLDGGRMWNDTIIEAIRRAPGTAIDLAFLGLGRYVLDTPRARRAAIDDVIGKLKYLPPVARQEQADALDRAVGADLPRAMMMRGEQLRALHAAGMSIGAHTVTHPILARLDHAEALSEIRAGRDYGPAHVAMIRELGFSAALSTRAGAADAASDRFQLPRFTPWGTTFLRFGVGIARNHLGHY